MIFRRRVSSGRHAENLDPHPLARHSRLASELDLHIISWRKCTLKSHDVYVPLALAHSSLESLAGPASLDEGKQTAEHCCFG
jgi:hypothetical protein